MPTIKISEELAERIDAVASRYQVTPTQVIEGLIETHLPAHQSQAPSTTVASLARVAQSSAIEVRIQDVSMRSNMLLAKEQQALLGRWAQSNQ